MLSLASLHTTSPANGEIGEVAGLSLRRPFAEVVERSLPSPMMARRFGEGFCEGAARG